MEALLDTARELETPEGVSLALRVAGPVPRALAWLIDLVARLAMVWVASFFTLLGESGVGIFLLLVFSVIWIYPVAMELLFKGQTLGKMALGLRVMRDNGAPVTWMPSIVRNLMRTADMFPLFYGFGLLSCLIDRHQRRLGDLVAGTVVVYATEAVPQYRLGEAAAFAPPVPLRPQEQKAVLAFAERAGSLTLPRQVELCDWLSGLTGLRGEHGRQRVLGMAQWLLGRR
jgi:uncharacterized RDD family membrane protein YckC